jgi:hypothetical protein
MRLLTTSDINDWLAWFPELRTLSENFRLVGMEIALRTESDNYEPTVFRYIPEKNS